MLVEADEACSEWKDKLPPAGREAHLYGFEPPSPVLSIPTVHVEKLICKETGFVTSGTGPDLQDGALLVCRVSGDQLQQHILLQLGQLHASKPFSVRISNSANAHCENFPLVLDVHRLFGGREEQGGAA